MFRLSRSGGGGGGGGKKVLFVSFLDAPLPVYQLLTASLSSCIIIVIKWGGGGR